MGKEMNRNDLTEAELERILRNSRFPNEKHKRELHEKIFGKPERGMTREYQDEKERKTELLPEDLELVAGGKTILPGFSPENMQNR